MINVLITSVGGGVGQSVVDSISHLSEYYIVGLDISSNVYARTQCDEFCISKRINERDYLKFLLTICKQYNIQVLIPGNDGELVLLSENIELFASIGTKVVVAPTKIVKSSRDKCQWFNDYSAQFPIVPTVRLSDYLNAISEHPEISFPAIAKPSSGSASSGIQILETRTEALALVDSNLVQDEYVIQPYLFPVKDDPDYDLLLAAVKNKRLLQISEISVQIVFSHNSEILGCFVSKNKLKKGVPVSIQPTDDPKVISVVNKLAQQLKDENVVGPVNVQGRFTDKGLIFFEMNLRFTGITGNRSQFGFNEVAAVIDSFMGKNIELPLSVNLRKEGARQVACRATYPLQKRNIETILVTGASSWAAKNFISYIRDLGFIENKSIILSSRNTEKLREAYQSILEPMKNVSVNFINVSEKSINIGVMKSDLVVNFASARPPSGEEAILESTFFNMMLIEQLKLSNIGLVINFSSQSVYQRNTGISQTEESKLVPSTAYSFSKSIIEHGFSSIDRVNKNISVVNLRLGRLWGGGLELPKDQLPYKMLDSIINGSHFKINNPSNMLNFVDVDDMSGLVLKVCVDWKNNKKIPNTLNVGGNNISLGDLYTTLEGVAEKEGVSFTPIIVSEGDSSKSDSLLLSNDLMRQFGFSTQFSAYDSWQKSLRLFLK